jgi:hypothetical protein
VCLSKMNVKGLYFYSHVRDTLVRSKDFKTFLFSVPTYHESNFTHAHIILRAPLDASIYELVPASPDATKAFHEIAEVSKVNLHTQYKGCQDITHNPLCESIASTQRRSS